MFHKKQFIALIASALNKEFGSNNGERARATLAVYDAIEKCPGLLPGDGLDRFDFEDALFHVARGRVSVQDALLKLQRGTKVKFVGPVSRAEQDNYLGFEGRIHERGNGFDNLDERAYYVRFEALPEHADDDDEDGKYKYLWLGIAQVQEVG
jgi:hypothetical protein